MALESIVINIAFVASCFVLYFSVGKIVKNSLNLYRAKISNQIDSSAQAKQEYKDLLIKISKRYDNLDKEVELTLQDARQHSKKTEENSRAEINKIIHDKMKIIEDSSAVYLKNQASKIRRECVEISFGVIEKLIKVNFASEEDQKLILVSVLDSFLKNNASES